MQAVLSFLLIFFGTFLFAQSPAVQNEEALTPAHYKPGTAELTKEFMRALDYAVDQNYHINGRFIFTFQIGKEGVAKIIDVQPKVQNTQALLDDLNYVLKKSHKRWQPAVRNGVRESSLYKFEIHFNTDTYDHD